jgi:hypothetical protein
LRAIKTRNHEALGNLLAHAINDKSESVAFLHAYAHRTMMNRIYGPLLCFGS